MNSTSKSPLEKAVDVGINVKGHFDWDNHLEVLNKVLEEVAELKEAIEQKTKEEAFDEMGDVLFTLAQLARHMNFNPEGALEFALKKHSLRYQRMTELIKAADLDMYEMTLEEIDPYWVQAKKDTKEDLNSLLSEMI